MSYEIRVRVHQTDYLGRVKVEKTELESVFLDVEAGEVVIHDGERCLVVAVRKPNSGHVGNDADKMVPSPTFFAVGRETTPASLYNGVLG